MHNELAKLARDLYQNKSMSYNGVSGQDALRKLFFESLGAEPGTKGMELYTAFKQNQYKVFQLIAVTTDASLPTVVKSHFDPLANVQVSASGDKPVFTVKNKDIFKASVIAAGTKDLRRQTKVDNSFTIDTDWVGVKVYAEFEQFLAGMIDWADFVDSAVAGFDNYIGELIYKSIATSYDAVRTNLKHTASGKFDIEKLVELARRVRVASGTQDVTVYGTVSALGQLAGVGLEKSDSMLDEINKVGYLKTVRGLKLVAFPDAYKAGTEDFLVDDKSLLIVPTGEKIVDVSLEGDALVIEDPYQQNNGLQLDFTIQKKLGVQVRKTAAYGFYKLS